MSKSLLITGGHGFLGRSVVKEFIANSDYEKVETFGTSEFDLRDRAAVRQLLLEKQPSTVVHLAARVGGIGANMVEPGTFFYDNLLMGLNLIEECRLFGIDKFLTTSTVCSYPKFTPIPFKESDIWNGYPEETNAPYGIAKKALMVQLDAYKQQYGFNGSTVLLTNLYGPDDNFDLQTSHVIPAMIRKFHAAKIEKSKSVTLWGDGSPSREFLHVSDAARAIRLATEHPSPPSPMNIGTGREVMMLELAQIIQSAVGFEGDIVWDSSKPNGQPRRCLDTRLAQSALNFKPEISLDAGISSLYSHFIEHLAEIISTGRANNITTRATANS